MSMMLSRSHVATVFLLILTTLALHGGQTKQPQASPVPPKQAAREGNPKAAIEFRKSQEAFNDGRLDKAIQYLRNGIALDPSNTDAYNDLGVIYANSNQPLKALEAFSAMVEIDPQCFRGYINLAYLLQAQQRYPDAERAARRAVDLRKMDLKARYLLGISLAAQKKNMEEAMENLAASAEEFPDAHLEMSRILIEQGQFDRAMRELQTFTRTGRLAGGGSRQLLAK